MALALTAIVTAAAILVGAWLASRGLDRTDDGLYLNSIAHPTADRSTILLFGYAYHPAFVVLGGDVVRLRWASLMLSVGAVASFAWVALGTGALSGGRTPVDPPARLVASLALGALGLVPIIQSSSTPSYNTLALQGLAVTGTGLLLAITRPPRRGVLGAALVGVGGWLTFLGKPTSAAVLAVLVVAVVLTVPGPWRRRTGVTAAALAASAGLTLVCAAASPAELVTIIRNGLDTSTVLQGHEDLVRWDRFPGPVYATASLAAGFVLVGCVLWLVDRSPRHRTSSLAISRGRGLLLTTVLVLGLAAIITLTVRSWAASDHIVTAPRSGISLLFLASGLALAAAGSASAVGAIRQRRITPASPGEEEGAVLYASWVGVPLVAFILLLPAAYAFGTNSNLWTVQGRAVAFWLVLLLCPASAARAHALADTRDSRPRPRHRSLAATAAAPYRYAPLSEADTPTPVGSGTVKLTAADAERTMNLRQLGRKLGVTDESRSST